MRFPTVFGLGVGILAFVLVASVSLGSGASLQGAMIRAAASGGFLTAVGWMAGTVMASAAGSGTLRTSNSQEGGSPGQPGTGDGPERAGRGFDLVIPPTSADDLFQPLNPPKVGGQDPSA